MHALNLKNLVAQEQEVDFTKEIPPWTLLIGETELKGRCKEKYMFSMNWKSLTIYCYTTLKRAGYKVYMKYVSEPLPMVQLQNNVT